MQATLDIMINERIREDQYVKGHIKKGGHVRSSKQGNVAKPTLHHLGTNVKWDEDPLGSLSITDTRDRAYTLVMTARYS
jgi:hypothetical protein